MSTTTEKDMYASIHDLPFVCRLNLPEPAQQVWREAFNRAWRSASDYRIAQQEAWVEVRRRFERDAAGRWRRRLLR